MTISLVMIVKNEEKILEKSIESVKEIVDEFVIVDTGSKDNTREIIKKYGKLHEIPFTNFVETKNKALELATSDYILFMDADERVVEGLEYIKEASNKDIDCLYAEIIEGVNEVSNVYLRARLWRNNGEYKFEGPGVHEVISGNGNNTLVDRRIKVLHDHSHREECSYKERFLNYVRILDEAIKKNPNDTRAIYYMGRTHQDLGNHQESIYYYERYLELDSNFRDEKWDAQYNIAKCWKAQGEYSKALVACENAEKIDSRRAEIYVFMGQILYELQEYEKAIECFEKAISMDIPEDVVLFLNPKEYFDIPADYLVLLYYKTKQYRKAEEIAEKLHYSKKNPDKRLLSNLNILRKETTKNIFFCLGNTPEGVYGGMIDDKGVGGVETTYLELPVEMTKLGHNVFVFCKCNDEHVYEHTYFIPYEKIEEYKHLNPDIIITSRWFEPLYMFPEAKKIIWAQDAHFSDPVYPDAYDIMDKLVCSSLWHRHYIAERFGERIPKEKIQIIPLSIRKELYTNADLVEKNPYQVIYSSNPDRGLYILKDMWEELTKRIPEIQLVITYGWEGLETWSSDKVWLDKIKSDKKVIEEWAEKAGNIRITGRLKKSDLAREQMGSSLCLYPNNFWESFCLTALEMQASGTPMITTDLGALSTTLENKSNILLNKYQYSSEYMNIFIKNTEFLLKNQLELKKLKEGCLNHIKGIPTWKDVAKTWEEMFYKL